MLRLQHPFFCCCNLRPRLRDASEGGDFLYFFSTPLQLYGFAASTCKNKKRAALLQPSSDYGSWGIWGLVVKGCG
jgi:hypothetical protein